MAQTPRPSSFKYDVALSFASEERGYVDSVARALKEAGVQVFYDKYEEVDLWGKNLYEHLADIYSRQARLCVMFISRHYAAKVWTNHERQNAQARALNERSEYILPVRFDDTEVPGLATTVGYVDLSGKTPAELATMIRSKLRQLHEPSETPGVETPRSNDAWLIKIDNTGGVVQSREELALVFSEMLAVSPIPEEINVAVDKEAMVNSIKLTRAMRALKDFGRTYDSINDSSDLVKLLSELASFRELSVRQREMRLDVIALHNLWKPLEVVMTTALLIYRNNIGRYYWLSTADEAADGARAFVSMYLGRRLGRDVESGTKIDMMREGEPQMYTSVRLSEEELKPFLSSLGVPAAFLQVRAVRFTAEEFDARVVRERVVPKIIEVALRDNLAILDTEVSDALFDLRSWDIGLG